MNTFKESSRKIVSYLLNAPTAATQPPYNEETSGAVTAVAVPEPA
jgi:hypothetical protein